MADKYVYACGETRSAKPGKRCRECGGYTMPDNIWKK